MRVHANAKATPNGRLLCQWVIDQGWLRSDAAAAAGITERTVAKWLSWFRAEGPDGLLAPSERWSSIT